MPSIATVLLACSTTSAFQLSGSPQSQRLVLQSSARIPVVISAPPRMPRPKMSFDLATTYITALNEHYYQTTVLQSLVLVSIGDLLAQALEANGDERSDMSFDWRRTLRMGMLGTVIGGLGTATWLRFLEAQLPIIEAHAAASFIDLPLGLYEPVLRTFETFGPEHGFGLDAVSDSLLVAVKATLDACVWAPIANTAYLVLTPLSEGQDLSSVGESLNENFLPVMKSELKTFFPYNLLAFAFIPPLVRPFTTGLISMCFSTYISWITHLTPSAQLVTAGGPQIRPGNMPETALLAMATDAATVLTSMDRIDAAGRVVAAMDRIDAPAPAAVAGASMKGDDVRSMAKPLRKKGFLVSSMKREEIRLMAKPLRKKGFLVS